MDPASINNDPVRTAQAQGTRWLFRQPQHRIAIIGGSRRYILVDLAELWLYREVLFFLVWRDLKVKYRQTYLGIIWAVLHPMIAVGVFTLVFSKLIGVSFGSIPYPLFVLCGLVPWNFFSRAVQSLTSSVVGNQDMVKRVYFPRLAIPIAAMLSALVDMALGFVIVSGALVYFLTVPPAQVFLLPVFLLVMMAAVLGVGLCLAAANVRYRDVGHIIPFGIQLLLFLTPVVYPANLMPDAWLILYSLNPMVGVLEGLRWCILGTPLDWVTVACSCPCSVGLLLIGLTYFARAERTFADVI
jgi:lipopolysaccharide transport system permease protein